MAANGSAIVEEDTCDVSDPSCRSETQDSIMRGTTVSLQDGSGQQTLSPTQSHPVVDVWNGSLPVAVPVGPGFHHVESSTTDSGVSNASSVASDCVPLPNLVAEEMPSDMHLELRKVERALRSRGSGNSSTEDTREYESTCVSGLPGADEGRRREGREEDELAGHMITSRLAKINIEDTRSDGDEQSSCSFTLDSSDTRPEHVSEHASFNEEGHLSPTSHSADMQSSSSMSVSEEMESPDSTVRHTHRESSGKSWSTRGLSPLKSVFSRTNKNRLSYLGSVDARSQGMIAASSTTGLILQGRPRTLPAKPAAEERRHQKLYEEMVTAARRKELQKAKETMLKEKQKQMRDKMVADSLREWQKILPNWENMRSSRRVRELWWLGLPPGVRGGVWRRAIGNDLNISPELYRISLTRCQEKLASMRRARSDSGGPLKGINREQSVEVIHLDVLRTFPTLGFFQEGGPYNQMLHDVLGAYACYRPDVGYVQGMSFLAGVLLLNMEASDAFICLANLLNRSSYMAFFRVDHTLMSPYFATFTALLQEYLPRVHAHFVQMEFSPEYYLIEWIFTMYTRTFPLDIACRVWDLFCRDGDCFLFRTALGVLRMFQAHIMERHTIEEVGQFLGRLPEDIDCDLLFQHIAAVNLTAKKFTQCLHQHSSS